MFNAVTWIIEVKCVVGKVKPSEETGLKLSHYTFTVFTHLKIFANAREELPQKL